MAFDIEVEKAWSNGTDTRTVRGEAEGFAENYIPYKSIGRLTAGCTGTFIGRKMVLTAAHCVLSASDAGQVVSFDRGGDLAYDWDLVFAPPTYTTRTVALANNFFPRYDRNTIATSWATVQALFYLVPLEYSDGTCTDITNCNRYDIALVLTSGPNPAGIPAGGTTTHPGYIGWYSGKAMAWHQANPAWLRGYPGCGTSPAWTRAARPGGWNSTTCVAETLYGDTEICDVGTGTNAINGYYAEYTIDCDGSPGMSAINGYYAEYTIDCDGSPGMRVRLRQKHG